MPAATVIIPNWNGAHLLATCLEALRMQSFRDFETLVVDNGSSDGSQDLIAREYPEVRVLALPENRLFAGAVNEGIRSSDSAIVVLLNNDTEADPAWLERLLPPFQDPGVGMAASKLRLYDRRAVLHSAGDYYRVDGVPGNRGVWEEDRGQYDGRRETFGPCGGAGAYRRRMLDEIGLFDEDLGAYCEDVDLAFRAQLAGYRCIFVPDAVVYHRLSATGGGAFASYYCGRNFISVAVKNMPGPLLRRYWPFILRAQLKLLLHSVAHVREPAARARLRGQLDGVRSLPTALRKRREVARLQRVPAGYIERILTPVE